MRKEIKKPNIPSGPTGTGSPSLSIRNLKMRVIIRKARMSLTGKMITDYFHSAYQYLFYQ